jgi:hypothetical protein
MTSNLERVQMLLEPDQRQALTRIARKQGKSVAEVTRQAIRTGLQVLEREDEFVKRSEALAKARQLNETMPLLDVDVVEDLQQLREARDEHISGSGH